MPRPDARKLPPQAQEDLRRRVLAAVRGGMGKTESARTLASVSNGLLIGGALVLATGVVLLLVDPGASPRPSAGRAFAGVRF